MSNPKPKSWKAVVILAALIVFAFFLTGYKARRSEIPSQPIKLTSQDLANNLKLQVSQIQLKKVEKVTWKDSCLGLSAPELCARGEITGYKITLSAQGKEYIYHTDTKTGFRYAGPGDFPQR